MKFLKLLILPCIFLFILTKVESQNDKPNVVVILTDDIGLGDISAYRRKHSNNIIVETPVIDQLMAEGMHFTDAHSPTALCAPSRYSIMTGNNTYRSYAPFGVWGSYERSSVEEDDLTMGRIMKRAGYNTAFFGKWHLASDYYRLNQRPTIYRNPRVPPELDVDVTEIAGRGPNHMGFDYSFMYPAGIQDVPYVVYENNFWYKLRNDSQITHITQEQMDQIEVTLDKDEGLGDSKWNPFEMGPLLVNKAVSYINENANKPKPFFMYYCTQAVHKPHTPTDNLDGKQIKGTTPVFHLDMVAELDAQMGMLVKALKEKGVYDNTLFIFTSDNGGLSFSATNNTGHRSNDIYRGAKNTIFEGGHRVPFIAVWPNKIQPNTIHDGLVSAQDIASTIASAANLNLTDDEAKDSFDLLPIMLGEPGCNTRKLLLNQGGTNRDFAYREGEWKLIMNTQLVPTHLYNLNNSPTENNNLVNSAQHRQRRDNMLATYRDIKNSRVATKTLHCPNNDNADIPIGDIISLRKCGGDNKLLTVENATTNNQVVAKSTQIGTAEKFLVEEHPRGGVALKSLLNNKYLRVFDIDVNIPIRAAADVKGDWTQFTWRKMAENKVALQSVHANKWMQADWNQNNSIVFPKGNTPGDWETFTYEVVDPILSTNDNAFYNGITFNRTPPELKINFTNTGKAKIAMYNLLGKKMFSKNYTIDNPGLKTIALNNNELPANMSPGIYLFKIKFKDNEKSIKIIID